MARALFGKDSKSVVVNTVTTDIQSSKATKSKKVDEQLSELPLTRSTVDDKVYCTNNKCGLQACEYHSLNINPRVGATHFEQVDRTERCPIFRKNNFTKH